MLEGADPAIIMEQQRLEFVATIKSILDSSKSKQTVWTIYKEELGVAEKALEEIPLDILRKLLSRLI